MTLSVWRSDAGRLRFTVASGMAAGLALSPRLWLSERAYPLSPVACFLKAPMYPWDWALYASVLLALALVALAPKPRVPVLVLGLFLLPMALFDQSRWQPWAYQYTFMLLAFAAKEELAPLTVGRLIVAFTYLWSGLQKFNPRFVNGTLDWLVEPFAAHWPASFHRAAHLAGYGAPVVETAIGLALLTGKLRRPAVIAAIGMHLFILLAIGPLGRNFNSVVWPWNLTMMVCLVLLFWRGELTWTGGKYAWAAAALFGLLPVLSLFNLWDSYLSVSLYSGNQNTGVIYLKDAVFERLPSALSDEVFAEDGEWNSIDINVWSYDAVNAPAYAEPRVFKNAARAICAYEREAGEVRLEVKGKWSARNGWGERTFGCGALR